MRTEITVLKVEPEVPEEDDVFLSSVEPLYLVGIEYGRAHKIVLILAVMQFPMTVPKKINQLIYTSVTDIG